MRNQSRRFSIIVLVRVGKPWLSLLLCIIQARSTFMTSVKVLKFKPGKDCVVLVFKTPNSTTIRSSYANILKVKLTGYSLMFHARARES